MRAARIPVRVSIYVRDSQLGTTRHIAERNQGEGGRVIAGLHGTIGTIAIGRPHRRRLKGQVGCARVVDEMHRPHKGRTAHIATRDRAHPIDVAQLTAKQVPQLLRRHTSLRRHNAQRNFAGLLNERRRWPATSDTKQSCCAIRVSDCEPAEGLNAHGGMPVGEEAQRLRKYVVRKRIDDRALLRELLACDCAKSSTFEASVMLKSCFACLGAEA